LEPAPTLLIPVSIISFNAICLKYFNLKFTIFNSSFSYALWPLHISSVPVPAAGCCGLFHVGMAAEAAALARFAKAFRSLKSLRRIRRFAAGSQMVAVQPGNPVSYSRARQAALRRSKWK